MADNCQHFKAAYLSRCRELGLSAEQTTLLAKESAALLKGELTKESGIGTTLLSSGILLPLGLAVAGGGLAGTALAQLPSFSETDPKELMTKEKIEAYDRVAQRLLMQQRLKELRRQAAVPSYSRL